jgi:transglutaminase-like putative cysteine protease
MIGTIGIRVPGVGATRNSSGAGAIGNASNGATKASASGGAATADSTGAVAREAARPKAGLLRKMFSDRPERSVWLRGISFTAAAWSVLTLIAVGAPPPVPLISMALIAVGHYFSHKRAGRSIPIVSLAIGVFIVALGVYMRNDLVAAIRGDRLPVTYFLLATGAASAFDLRTRASLYTQLIFAGIVTFFASEIAFAGMFAPFLVVFGLITGAFLAKAWLEDEMQGVRAVWFSTRTSQVAVWAAITAGVVALGILAFLAMPWNAAQTPHAPQFAVLPFSGAEQGDVPPLSPEAAKQLTKERRASLDGLSTGISEDGEADTLGGGQATGGAGMAGVQELGKDGLTAEVMIAEPLTPPGPMTDEVVMYVRSPVASYWRGRTYDQFDPTGGAEGKGEWLASGKEQTDGLPPASARRRTRGDDDTRYLQTFFIHHDAGETVLSGYEAVAAAVPRGDDDRPALTDGSTYQVVSSQPPLSIDRLRNDRSRWVDQRYVQIPEGMGYLHSLSAQVTRDSTTHFDRASAIASYLHQLELDEAAPSQLESSASLEQFVFGETPGTSLDFATAMVLMARASGLTARLATGYLPGDYNPLSGANTVTGKEAHVWAEVHFDKSGWVPFDTAPRKDLPSVTTTVRPAPAGGLGFLLDHRFGDNMAQAATRAPASAIAETFKFLGRGIQALVALIALAAMATMTWLSWRWLRDRKHEISMRRQYASLDDPERRAVREAFRRAEAQIARAGFRRRAPQESYATYSAQVRARFEAIAREMAALTNAVSRAAYSAQPLPEGTAEGARMSMATVREQLRRDLRRDLREA